jgi:pimeloyl-ACP methyl ester carboxylesterase
MVLLGHSMGGLISKLQVTHSGTFLWQQVANRPLQSIRATPEVQRELQRLFLFEPQSHIRRVVLIGTPHGGSSWASRSLGRLGSYFIEPAPDDEMAHQQLMAYNPGVFSPRVRQRFPTSIDMLEPSDPVLVAMRQLPVNPHARLHSIIGYGYSTLSPEDGDGIVPVSSARHAGVVSERFVRASHRRLHWHRDTVNEVLRILAVHAAEYDAAAGGP